MDYDQLQAYKFISIHSFCCSESIKFYKKIPLLFPNHEVKIIRDPIRRINFKGNVRMGEVEARLHGTLCNINEWIEKYEKLCVNLIPLLNVMWIKQFKKVSPYLVQEAVDLFEKFNLCVLPIKEELPNRDGDSSWFDRCDSKVINIEREWSASLAKSLYDNSIDYITWNKLFQIAQDNKL